MKRSTELKKITQECLHAEKMAKKWVDKAERKREKVTELENVEMIDYLRKNNVGIDDLPELVENLPKLGRKTTEKKEELSEIDNETEMEKENYTHDETI